MDKSNFIFITYYPSYDQYMLSIYTEFSPESELFNMLYVI